MSRRSRWPWVLLLVWSTWIYALVGRFAAEPGVRGFAPDLGLVLLLGLEPRLSARDAIVAALIVGAARAAFSADPPAAILSGLIAVAALSRAVRHVVESDAALPRAAVAGIASLAFGAFLALAHQARLGPLRAAPAPALGDVARAALATALVSPFLLPVLVRLPGLRPLAAPRRPSMTRATRAIA